MRRGFLRLEQEASSLEDAKTMVHDIALGLEKGPLVWIDHIAAFRCEDISAIRIVTREKR